MLKKFICLESIQKIKDNLPQTTLNQYERTE